MKKQKFVSMVLLCGAFALAGCKHEHVWEEATCETAKYCTECEATEGEALGHVWADATCTLPKTCKTCGTTEGVRAGHKFLDATCDKPKECEVCGETKGEPLVHNGRRVGRCKLCGVVQNKELVTELGERYETAYSDFVAVATAIMQDTTELAEELAEELNPLSELNDDTDPETVFIGGHPISTITLGEYLEWADGWTRKLYWEERMEDYTELRVLYEEIYSMCGDYSELRAVKEKAKEIVDLIPLTIPEKERTGGDYDVRLLESSSEQFNEVLEQWKTDGLEDIEWLGEVEKKMGEWKKEYDKVNALFK